MSLKLQTAATVVPVSLAEAKLHLKVDVSDDDALISSLITAATLDAEHLMGRALLPQKWQLSLDSFPTDPNSPWWNPAVVARVAIALQRPPVTGVDSIKYVDAVTGVLTTLASGSYQAVLASDYTASVVPAYGLAWPTARVQPEAVQVIFSCGYADAAAVPEPIKAWVKLKIGALYLNRELIAVGSRIVRVDLPFDSLLDRYRTWLL